jgi:hypothetical protein
VKRLAVIGVLAALAAAGSGVGTSSAAFTAHSAAKATISAASDWTGPSVSILSPSDGATFTSSSPTLFGAAGTDDGDSATVSFTLFSGSSSTGTPVLTRSASRIAGFWYVPSNSLADGTYTMLVTQTDADGNTGRATRTFTIDATDPSRVSVTATNGSGGTTGRLEAGDVITYTYSEPIAPSSILSGLTGAAAPVKVRFFNATTDGFTVLDASSQANVKLDAGTTSAAGVSLGSGANYVSNTVTFNGTMSQSADGRSFSIVLGSNDNASRVSSTVSGTSKLTWTPKSGPTDLAGNAMTSTTAYSETTAVRHF